MIDNEILWKDEHKKFRRWSPILDLFYGFRHQILWDVSNFCYFFRVSMWWCKKVFLWASWLTTSFISWEEIKKKQDRVETKQKKNQKSHLIRKIWNSNLPSIDGENGRRPIIFITFFNSLPFKWIDGYRTLIEERELRDGQE